MNYDACHRLGDAQQDRLKDMTARRPPWGHTASRWKFCVVLSSSSSNPGSAGCGTWRGRARTAEASVNAVGRICPSPVGDGSRYLCQYSPSARLSPSRTVTFSLPYLCSRLTAPSDFELSPRDSDTQPPRCECNPQNPYLVLDAS